MNEQDASKTRTAPVVLVGGRIAEVDREQLDDGPKNEEDREEDPQHRGDLSHAPGYRGSFSRNGDCAGSCRPVTLPPGVDGSFVVAGQVAELVRPAPTA
jgi:hypothetical protein